MNGKTSIITTPAGQRFGKGRGSIDHPAAADLDGYYTRSRNGLLLHDRTGDPFTFIVTDPSRPFVVTAHAVQSGGRRRTHFMFGATQQTVARLVGTGLDGWEVDGPRRRNVVDAWLATLAGTAAAT